MRPGHARYLPGQPLCAVCSLQEVRASWTLQWTTAAIVSPTLQCPGSKRPPTCPRQIAGAYAQALTTPFHHPARRLCPLLSSTSSGSGRYLCGAPSLSAVCHEGQGSARAAVLQVQASRASSVASPSTPRSVTKNLSGAARATIDACRTLFIWLFALRMGWERFHALQVR